MAPYGGIGGSLLSRIGQGCGSGEMCVGGQAPGGLPGICSGSPPNAASATKPRPR